MRQLMMYTCKYNTKIKFDNFIFMQIIHEVQSRKLRRHSIISLIEKKAILYIDTTLKYNSFAIGKINPYFCIERKTETYIQILNDKQVLNE